MVIVQSVEAACFWALVVAIPLQWQGDLFAKFAHPTNLSGRHADHEGVGFDVFVDHGAGANEGVFADGYTTDDGAVRTQGGALFNQCVAVFVFALDERTGVVDIGEHHAGAAEHALFEGDVVVHADVVLDLAVVADVDLVADEDVLPKRDAFANLGAAADVNPVPDAASFADLCAVVNDCGGVDGDLGHIWIIVTDGI